MIFLVHVRQIPTVSLIDSENKPVFIFFPNIGPLVGFEVQETK